MRITKPDNSELKGVIHLTRSKSESNRALIIKALCNEYIEIKNLSDSDDTSVLNKILETYTTKKEINVHHAGTAFRFLTAFLSIQEGTWILTGSNQMKKRPIKVLVDNLVKHGAKIEYLEKTGYPPLKIQGTGIDLATIEIDGSISSQYISALLLIAPTQDQDIQISFQGKITSRPYIEMTLSIMKHFGAKTTFIGNKIAIRNSEYIGGNISIEADWSAASYWYEIVALSEKATIEISGLKQNSIQGDSAIATIFSQLGVSTKFKPDSIVISKNKTETPSKINFNFVNTPDIAQTVLCTCAGLGIETTISGLSTLTIKETNRLEALKNELLKFGVAIDIIDNHSMYLYGNQNLTSPKHKIETYNDHRMAMAFAPLALKTSGFQIRNPKVVTKSYPTFWKDLRRVGFKLEN